MSLDRVGEVVRCIRNVKQFPGAISGFVGVRKLQYPKTFHLRDGAALTIYDFEDLTTLWAVWCAGEYNVPSDARVIVDAGANIGAFSLFSLASAPAAKVIAIEPFPSTYAKLAEVVTTNNLTAKVICLQAALTAQTTTLFMDSNPEIKSHSRKALAAGGGHAPIAVAGMGLGDILAANQLDQIDYLKIDIEGGEVPLFQDIEPDTLRRAAKVAVECHSRAGQDIVWAKLETSGFKLDRVSRGARFTEASTAEFIRS